MRHGQAQGGPAQGADGGREEAVKCPTCDGEAELWHERAMELLRLVKKLIPSAPDALAVEIMVTLVKVSEEPK